MKQNKKTSNDPPYLKEARARKYEALNRLAEAPDFESALRAYHVYQKVDLEYNLAVGRWNDERRIK
jgi:hypothetical protein